MTTDTKDQGHPEAKRMTEASKERVLVWVGEMLDHPEVEVAVSNGIRDTTGPLDTFRVVEPDGSRRLVIEIPPDTP